MPNTFKGTEWDDFLEGYITNDTLIGLGGDDILDGGKGADIMKGGEDDDQYYVDDHGDEVIEYAGEGHDTVVTTVTFGLDDHVEDLWMGGSANIDGYGNSSNNEMWGNGGNNHLYGFEGNDTLHGNGGKDIMYGGDGDDTLDGGTGADKMYGGRNNDTYYVDSAYDTTIELEGMGWDTVHASVSHALAANVDALILDGKSNIDGAGNGLDNVLTGNSGNNMLFGYAGADTLDGGKGEDTLFGGDGDDIYYVEGDFDHVIEHAGPNGGIDRVYSSGFITTLSDNVEILQLTGNAVIAFGNDLGNTIVGTDDGNYLDGEGGADNLTGGDGRDTFVFSAGEGNGDAIYDFNGNGAGLGDILEFQGYGEDGIFEQISATEWRISSADGLIQDTIVLINGASIDASDWHFT